MSSDLKSKVTNWDQKIKLMNIGIVGYGPAGIVAGMALKRRGHTITIFERDERYDLRQAGDVNRLDRDKTYPIDIGAKGCRAIKYLGIEPFFEKHCNSFKGTRLLGDGSMLGPEEPEGHYGYMGARVELMWALTEAQETLAPDIKVYYSTKVESIDPDAKTIHTLCEDKRESHSFDLIIGTDGAGSLVRRELQNKGLIECEEHRGQQYAKSIFVDYPDEKVFTDYITVIPNLAYFTVFGRLKCTGNEKASCIIISGKDQRKFKSFEEGKAYLKDIDPWFEGKISDEEINNWMQRDYFNLDKSVKCNQYYYQDKVVLLGDAAHPFKPIGQGINLAMWDGLNLEIAIDTLWPNDLGKALQQFSIESKLQGDACIGLAAGFTDNHDKAREFLTLSMGIYENLPITGCRDIAKDFNSQWEVVETTHRAQSFFLKYLLFVFTIFLICLGPNYMTGFAAIFIILLLTISYWAYLLRGRSNNKSLYVAAACIGLAL